MWNVMYNTSGKLTCQLAHVERGHWPSFRAAEMLRSLACHQVWSAATAWSDQVMTT